MSQDIAITDNDKGLFTPFNVITGIIIAMGLVLTVLRFTGGLGMVTNLDNANPWGIWIGFDLLAGVALAAGGYTTSAAVYLFGMKKYHSAVRPAIMTGFLGYSMVVVSLLFDVGQPLRLPYPMVVSMGTSSVLFEVALCVGTYLFVLFLEFSNAPLEWLGIKKVARLISRMTIFLTIFGVMLSTMHQSSLGALFLIAPNKLHPLWYSPYLPIFFLISSIPAGLSMVIFEGGLSHKYFHHMMDKTHLEEADQVTLGFGKAAFWVLMAYFVIKIFVLLHDHSYVYLISPYGYWFLVEILGFVLLPCLVFYVGVKERKLRAIRFAALLTILGIILNRANVCLIAFNWELPTEMKYVPSLMEIGITVFLITLEIVAFKFIVTRMPILYQHPDFTDSH